MSDWEHVGEYVCFMSNKTATLACSCIDLLGLNSNQRLWWIGVKAKAPDRRNLDRQARSRADIRKTGTRLLENVLYWSPWWLYGGLGVTVRHGTVSVDGQRSTSPEKNRTVLYPEIRKHIPHTHTRTHTNTTVLRVCFSVWVFAKGSLKLLFDFGGWVFMILF